MFGVAYAFVFFLHNEEVAQGNLTSDMVTIEVSDEGSISLEDTSPKTDEEGLNGVSKTITITNTSKIDTLYTISLTPSDTNTIDTTSIRYGLYINGVLKKTDYVGESNIVYESLLLQGETINVEIYLWVDTYYEGTGTSFSGTFNVDADEAVMTITDYISKLVGKDKGVYAINNSDAVSTDVTDIKEYRYSGNNAHNYIWFNCQNGTTGGSSNCELWRIVGNFNVKANEYANSYPRLKIVKEESLDNQVFGTNNTYSGSTIATYLNGDYYNGLTTSAKKMIIDSGWNVGSSVLTNTPSASLTSEQLTKVYTKVGLLTASDIGYSTNTDNYTKTLNDTDLYTNSWLKGSSYYTLTPITDSTTTVIGNNSTALASVDVTTETGIKPSVYLIPNVYIKAGNGTLNKPYELNYIDEEEYYSDIPVVGYITYDANGGDVTAPKKQAIYADGNTVISGGFDDASFAGWATSADGEVVYQKGDTVTVKNSITLYAVWEETGTEYLVDKVTSTISLTEADSDGTRFVTGNTSASATETSNNLSGFKPNNLLNTTNNSLNNVSEIENSVDVNNYVSYSGMLWRVVSINSDNTIKLVTNEVVSSMCWTEDFEIEYVDSEIRNWLINTFLPTLDNYDKFLVDHDWDYTSYSSFPTTKLTPSNTVTEKVGLLNIYEYMMTGGVGRASASSNTTFLKNNFWTMSPSGTSGFWVLTSDTVGEYARVYPPMEEDGVSPSIVLSSSVLIGDVDGDGNAGNGTASEPYEIYVAENGNT